MTDKPIRTPEQRAIASLTRRLARAQKRARDLEVSMSKSHALRQLARVYEMWGRVVDENAKLRRELDEAKALIKNLQQDGTQLALKVVALIRGAKL